PERPIAMNRPEPGHAEHDSEEIWSAVCAAVRAARDDAGAGAADIVGIGFDATCSLVVRGRQGEQIAVSTGGETRWDTIAWLDHRASAEAEECTASLHKVLDFSGGVMSPEMQVPKLMWLKRRLPGSWAKSGHFFDLADYLTFRASGSEARSLCTLTCKWTYLAHEEEGWRQDFFERMGISDLLERGSLPRRAIPVGSDLGPLTVEAALGLGLTTACRVAAGIV
ncbi:FGGY family carbohydrate kinase, partial [Rhizobiaceae sp. 2RAB30]